MRPDFIVDSRGARSASEHNALASLAADLEGLVDDIAVELSQRGSLSPDVSDRLHQMLERALSL